MVSSVKAMFGFEEMRTFEAKHKQERNRQKLQGMALASQKHTYIILTPLNPTFI